VLYATLANRSGAHLRIRRASPFEVAEAMALEAKEGSA